MADNRYTNLITSEHNKQPNYMEMVYLTTQTQVDQQATLALFDASYDLDTAIGSQLDVCGLWIGASRNIKIPITDLYFALDTAGVGLDEGFWFIDGEAGYTIYSLSDGDYRLLLQAKALANKWDGTYDGAVVIYNFYFATTGRQILIHDNQDMTYQLEVVGDPIIEAIVQILDQDILGLRPAGVEQLPTIVP